MGYDLSRTVLVAPVQVNSQPLKEKKVVTITKSGALVSKKHSHSKQAADSQPQTSSNSTGVENITISEESMNAVLNFAESIIHQCRVIESFISIVYDNEDSQPRTTQTSSSSLSLSSSSSSSRAVVNREERSDRNPVKDIDKTFLSELALLYESVRKNEMLLLIRLLILVLFDPEHVLYCCIVLYCIVLYCIVLQIIPTAKQIANRISDKIASVVAGNQSIDPVIDLQHQQRWMIDTQRKVLRNLNVASKIILEVLFQFCHCIFFVVSVCMCMCVSLCVYACVYLLIMMHGVIYWQCMYDAMILTGRFLCASYAGYYIHLCQQKQLQLWRLHPLTSKLNLLGMHQYFRSKTAF